MASEKDKQEETKSFQISPASTPTRVRFHYGVGIFCFIVAGFIAVPFREQCPFVLPSAIPISIGLGSSKSGTQKLVGTMIILVISSTVLLSIFSS